ACRLTPPRSVAPNLARTMRRSQRRSPLTCPAISPAALSGRPAIFGQSLGSLGPLVLQNASIVYRGRPLIVDRRGFLDLQLAGKSALITGASKGIGRATALTLAAEGCSLHLAARSGNELEQLRNDIRAQHGVKVDLHPGDLSTTQSMIALA